MLDLLFAFYPPEADFTADDNARNDVGNQKRQPHKACKKGNHRCGNDGDGYGGKQVGVVHAQ